MTAKNLSVQNLTDLPEVKQKLEEIAKRILRVETLETRKSDSLDFYDTAVWSMKEALEEAFMAGFDSALDTVGDSTD